MEIKMGINKMIGAGSGGQMAKWLYVFIRTDLPATHQAVQAAHAVFEASQLYDGLHPSFVFLSVDNKKQLELAQISFEGLVQYPFYETYADWGLTAFAIEPVTEDKRHLFKEYKLWRV